MQFALTYAPHAFDLRGKVMGRQSAGAGFLRAALDARPERIWCYAGTRELAEAFGSDVRVLTMAPPELRYIAWAHPERLAQVGTLYRADPAIDDDAWLRQRHSGARTYSLCGITHTLSSKGVPTAIGNYLDAPLYSWDAVICTSRVARDVLISTLERRIEHLRSRLGASNFTVPQLPLIPLGVHCDDFVATLGGRETARASLDIAPDDVAFLFAGRLSFHAKAHPLPMLLALQRAAQATQKTIHLLLFGQSANEAIGEAFRADTAQLAPSVRVTFLDGKDERNKGKAWAAADVFTSLSDNIQETFGLTPIEAMAAGLPAVVSDWNGYKDTVRDGVDGFRIPTMLPPPGMGNDLSASFEHPLANYDRYIGEVSMFTAVDVGAATEAYSKLIESPPLRRQMGQAGHKRAREIYDWSIVFRRYVDLWDELAERRRSDPKMPGEQRRSARPDLPEPFDLFKTYPTSPLRPDMRVRLVEGVTLEVAAARRALKSVAFAASVLPSDKVISTLLKHLASDPAGMTIADLCAASSEIPDIGIFRSVAWLAKMGLVQIEIRSGR